MVAGGKLNLSFTPWGYTACFWQAFASSLYYIYNRIELSGNFCKNNGIAHIFSSPLILAGIDQSGGGILH